MFFPCWYYFLTVDKNNQFKIMGSCKMYYLIEYPKDHFERYVLIFLFHSVALPSLWWWLFFVALTAGAFFWPGVVRLARALRGSPSSRMPLGGPFFSFKYESQFAMRFYQRSISCLCKVHPFCNRHRCVCADLRLLHAKQFTPFICARCFVEKTVAEWYIKEPFDIVKKTPKSMDLAELFTCWIQNVIKNAAVVPSSKKEFKNKKKHFVPVN